MEGVQGGKIFSVLHLPQIKEDNSTGGKCFTRSLMGKQEGPNTIPEYKVIMYTIVLYICTVSKHEVSVYTPA